MKKFFIIATAVILAIALAAPLFAMDFKASGFVRVRSLWMDNFPDFDDDNHDSRSFVDNRARVKFSFTQDNVTGVVYLEMDGVWGNGPGDRNHAGFWGADRAAVEVKNYYIKFKVPRIPVSLTAGVQSFAIRPAAFQYTDGGGLKITVNAKPVKANLFWMKPWEGSTQDSQDTDIYAADVAVNVGPAKVGMFAEYMNAKCYPLNNDTGRMDAWWVGVNGSGKVGPVKFSMDFIYGDGEYENHDTDVDTDYSGWLVMGKVGYVLNKYEFGFEGFYASGQDYNDTDFDGYFIPPASEAGSIYVPAVVVLGSPVYDHGYLPGNYSWGSVSKGAWSGLWLAKIYANIPVLDWLILYPGAMVIGNTEDNGNRIWGANGDDEAIGGYEFDIIAKLKITKNLTYSVGAGYLFVDDGFLNQAHDPDDDAWGVVSNLIYKF